MEKTITPPSSDFEGLVALVRILRSEKGCPWDRQQTVHQIKTYLLEEAYEVIEALDSHGPEDVCGELGDLLFHIIFVASIFEESGDFAIRDVLSTIVEKMIRRHPHVFGEATVNGPEDVKRRWHEIKMAEAREKEPRKSDPFAPVPRSLPALMRAYRVVERAGKSGLIRSDTDTLLQRLDQVLLAFKEAVQSVDEEGKARTLGQLLLTAIQIAHTQNVHPESALADTVRELENRCKTSAS